MKSCVWLAVAAVLTLGSVGRAQAASVAVLGVDSLDAEDELERRLSQALSASAKKVEGFTVGDRALSLEQMMLAHGCDEPSAACLNDIARTLSVERLLYGTVSATAGTHELTLFTYTTSASRVESKALRSVPDDRLANAQVTTETVAGLLRRLLNPASTGQLQLTGNPPGSEILVDGSSRGLLDEAGTLVVELDPGEHRVRAARPGYHVTKERTVAIEAGETTRLDITLEKHTTLETTPPPEPEPEPVVETAPVRPRRNLKRIFGWVSVGLGAAFAAATVYTWVRIHSLNDNADFKAYRASFPRAGSEGGVSDVCTEAQVGSLAGKDASKAGLEAKARDHCDEASKLEVLQYVFGGGTLLAGGLGTYLLISARSHETATLSLHPHVGAHSAGLGASLRF